MPGKMTLNAHQLDMKAIRKLCLDGKPPTAFKIPPFTGMWIIEHVTAHESRQLNGVLGSAHIGSGFQITLRQVVPVRKGKSK